MLTDLPSELLVNEIVPRLRSNDFLSLLATNHPFQERLLSIVHLKTMMMNDNEGRLLKQWVWRAIALPKLFDLLERMRLNLSGKILDQLYIILRINGEYESARTIKEKIWTEQYISRVFLIHDSSYRYLEHLCTYEEIFNSSSSFMNRLSRAIEPFFHRFYDYLNPPYFVGVLMEVLLGRMDDSQIENIITTNVRGRRLSIFRRSIITHIVRSRRYRITLPIINHRGGPSGYSTRSVAQLYIGSLSRPPLPAQWADHILSFIRSTSILSWNGPINVIATHEDARNALREFIATMLSNGSIREKIDSVSSRLTPNELYLVPSDR